MAIHPVIPYTPRVSYAVWVTVAALVGVASRELARRDSERQRERGAAFADVRFTSYQWSVVVACALCVAIVAVSALQNDHDSVVLHCVLAGTGTWLSLVDIDTHTVPRRSQMIAWSVAAVMFASLSFVTGSVAMDRVMAGALTMWGAVKAIEVLSRGELGAADAVVAGYLGMFVGHRSITLVPVALTTAFVSGGVAAAVLMVVCRFGRRSHLPFVPFLFLGAVVAVLR